MIINPYMFTAAATDPNWSSVSLLLHMDGTDGSTTFTDQKGKTVTAVGNAQIDTAQYKFGGASGLFDGTGDRLTVPASADFNFGTGDLTIEWWARFNSVSGIQYFYEIGLNNTMARLQNGTTLLVYNAAGANMNTNISTLSANTWYYMAVVRSGNNWNFYVNGTSVANGTRSGNAGDSTNTLYIGDYTSAGYAFNGWLDDFRITKGVARYTANFTPPSAAFPNS